MIKPKDCTSALICFSGRRPGQGKWWERLVATCIKKITKSKWTHVCFVFKNENDAVMVLEATDPKVQMVPLDEALAPHIHYRKIYRINLWDVKNFNDIIMLLWYRYRFEKYGFWQLLFTPLAMLFWSKNLATRGLVCSELVLEGLLLGRLKNLFEFYNFDGDKVSPQDLENVLFPLSFSGDVEIIEDTSV